MPEEFDEQNIFPYFVYLHLTYLFIAIKNFHAIPFLRPDSAEDETFRKGCEQGRAGWRAERVFL